ncbi:hypothetical protein BJ322DRAFT_1102552 [Thelephora terrestris]|uniref:Uncharacterized protein n=1 Tax=Thelephora terrestris TaxID=56493 RepID=A0A9P6HPE9_9AGAM|nr:hypothetical protein BJ322DRAFT_1102552 [Thelephora terrestris]
MSIQRSCDRASKGPNVAAVKVLGGDCIGQTFEIAYGPDFVAIEYKRTGSPTIVPSSLGGGVSNAVESALVKFGVVVAARN